jgi:hypothetical protein
VNETNSEQIIFPDPLDHPIHPKHHPGDGHQDLDFRKGAFHKGTFSAQTASAQADIGELA